jgi:hypothetical protein
MMKKIGIIGTRKRNIRTDYIIVRDQFFSIYDEGDWIVSGHCDRGGDKFAEKIMEDYGIPTLIFPPKKKQAKYFFARNKFIAKHSNIIIACLINPHEPLDQILKRTSGGSEHTLKCFRKFYPEGEIIVV